MTGRVDTQTLGHEALLICLWTNLTTCSPSILPFLWQALDVSPLPPSPHMYYTQNTCTALRDVHTAPTCVAGSTRVTTDLPLAQRGCLALSCAKWCRCPGVQVK